MPYLEPSNAKIDELNERFRPYARRLVEIADRMAQDEGKRVRITRAYRTKAEQDALYAQGRNGNPGGIVTYVAGGYSWHNYGLALDLGIFSEGFATYLGNDPLYREIGKEILATPELAEVFWGGMFPSVFGGTFLDLPHYEWHPGHSVKDGAGAILKYIDHPQDVGLTPTVFVTPAAVVPQSDTTMSVTGAILVGSPDWMELKAIYSDIHKARISVQESENTISALRAAEVAIYKKYDQNFEVF